MKKDKVLLIFEGISVIGFVITGLLCLFEIMESISTYSDTQSLNIFEFTFLSIIVYIILLLFFVILSFILNKKLKQSGVTSFIKKINNQINNHKIISITSTFLIVFVIFISLLVTIQEEMLYFPDHSEYQEQALKDTHKYKKMTFSFEDTTYSGWGKIDVYDMEKQTILYFGGNAEYSSNTFYYYNQNNWKGLEDYNFIMIDYPGFGLSTDEITEENIYSMSIYIFDAIKTFEDINQDKIIVMGFSLGTGVASYLSANRDFSKLILLAPYTSMTDVVNSKFPLFYGPLKSLVRHPYDTYARVDDMNEETLIIASKGDQIVKINLTNKLIEKLEPSSQLILNDLGHNDLLSSDAVYDKINSYLND